MTRRVVSAALRHRIEAAVNAVRERGIDVVPGGYGVAFVGGKWAIVPQPPGQPQNVCCPMGALLLTEQPPYPDDNGSCDDMQARACARLLDVTQAEVERFVAEFDHLLILGECSESEMWFLGAHFKTCWSRGELKAVRP